MDPTGLRQFENRDACLQKYESSTIAHLFAGRAADCPHGFSHGRTSSTSMAEGDLSDVVTSSSGVSVEPVLV